MTVLMAAAWPNRIPLWSGGRTWVVARLKALQRSSRLVPLASTGVVVCSIVLPLVELARIATDAELPNPDHATHALVATSISAAWSAQYSGG